MQRRYNSVTKLPQISIKKKEKIINACRKFDEEIRIVEQKQQINSHTMSKFDFLYGTHRKSFISKKTLLQEARSEAEKEIVLYDEKEKDQVNDERLKSGSLHKKIKIKLREKVEKQSELIKMKLAETKEFMYKTPQKLNLRELAELQAEKDVNQTSKRKKSAVVIKSERERQVLPFYSVEQKKMIPISYIKMRQETGQEKVKIRMANGIIKEVNRNTIYYKVGDSEQQEQKKQQKQESEELQAQIRNCHINIDYSLLNDIMGRVSKQVPASRRQQLMQDLIQNYKMSVNLFNNNFKKPGWIKNKIKHMNSMTVQKSLVNSLETNLICSDELQFLSIFNLDKRRYLFLLVQAQDIVRSMEEFIHFDIFELITILANQNAASLPSPANNLSKQDSDEEKSNMQVIKIKEEPIKKQKKNLDPAEHYKASKMITNENIDDHLKNKKSQIELKIYTIQQQIQKIRSILYKDIEHVIKLNPKLVGTPYQEYTRIFINKFSKYLGVILRSVISRAVYDQLQQLGSYFLQYFDLQFTGVLRINHPNTDFYQCITKINKPFITPFSKVQILHGPILIMLDVKINKMKRKTLRNVYKFLIESRKQIRAYPHKISSHATDGRRKQSTFHETHNNNGRKQRIFFNNCYDILKAHIIQPIQKYIEIYLSNSENINGCISNINLDIHRYGQFELFVEKIKLLSEKIEQSVIHKYQEYFSYWELYLMERPYIQQMIALFKRINGIQLMQDEMKNLESDLRIIKEFPNVIEDKVVRIDISEIKQRIISTITVNIKQIGKASQEVLQRLLSIGQAETLKARKLNQITPYSTIAEYINFAKALSSRGVERSIERVALNAVVLAQNWNFLEQHNFPVRTKIMGQYLQSCVWVRMLRKAANANRMKLTVDPQIFSNGVIEKKYKIYFKYMFIVKQIAEIIKLSDLAHWDRYAALSKNIHSELQQIVSIAKDISQEENLLRIQYYDDTKEQVQKEQKKEEGKDVKSEKILTQNRELSHNKSRGTYKESFLFFYKEEIYISKFAKFWQYVIKFKNQVEDSNRLTLYEIHGENILKVVREGQEILYELKITTINKRLLGLVEKLYKEMEPYVRHSRIIKVLCNGSQNSRTRALFELKKQIMEHIEKKKKEIEERKRKAEQQILKKQLQNAANNKEAQSKEEDAAKQIGGNKEQGIQQIKQNEQEKKPQVIDQQQFERATISNLQSFLKFEEFHLTLKELIETPIPPLDFTPFYQMYLAERRKEQIMAKIKKVSHQIKLVDVKVIEIAVTQPLPRVQFLEVPPSLIHYILNQNKQMLEIVDELTEKSKQKSYHQLSQIYEEYAKQVYQCSKKLSIFSQSLQKMKNVEPEMYPLFSWFQLILPSLMPASSTIIALYRPLYEQFSLQYNKKLQLIKKLGYSNLYEDRVRINFDKELEKFQELKIKLFNHPIFGMMALSKNQNYCCVKSTEHLFSFFSHMSTFLIRVQDIQNLKKAENTLKTIYKENFSSKATPLDHCLPYGLQGLSFTLRFSEKQKCFYIRSYRFSTSHQQVITLNEPTQATVDATQKSKSNKKQIRESGIRQQRLFTVQLHQPDKAVEAESGHAPPQTYTCQSGILSIIDKISGLMKQTLKSQVLELLPVIYSFHYNIKDIFTMYITLTNCLFQSVLTCLYATFYMDLLLVWENDYDILVLKEKLRECYENGFEAKESQNNWLVEEIYKCYEIFIAIIDMIVRRKSQETDRDIEGPNIDAEKLRKKLITQFVPVLIFEQFNSPKNKKKNRQWLLLLKKDKEDDFINETNLNPAFQEIMNGFGYTNERVREIMDKVELKEIEKKDEIPFSKISQSIFNVIPTLNPIKKNMQKKKTNPNQFQLVVKGYSNFNMEYGYEMVRSLSSSYDNTEAVVNATWLITQAQRHQKILITNCHPNSQILGRNIINRSIKICRNVDLRELRQFESKSKIKQKKNKTKQIKDDIISLNSNGSQLRGSMMSLDASRVQRKIPTLTTKKQVKNVVSGSIYELQQWMDEEQLAIFKPNQAQLMIEQAASVLNRISCNPFDCYCIHVEDGESLTWVIDYLVTIRTKKMAEEEQGNSSSKQLPLVYIFCMQIDADLLKKQPNLDYCLVYSKDYSATSNAVIHTPYNQNRLFTQKTTTHKDPLNSKLKQTLGSENANNNKNSNEGNSAFMPLPYHLHTNPLLGHYNALYPYSTVTTGSKIFQNTLLYPIMQGQASSPNIVRNPLNPKYRQLIHKNIIKYYSELKIEEYLELSHMEPIVHGLHYNAFIVPSTHTTHGGLLNNYGSYVVNTQIKNVMGRVWHLVMEDINRMQMGENVQANNSFSNIQITNVDLYVIPAHAMRISELLGELRSSISVNNMSYHLVPKQGALENILKLAVMASNLVVGDKTSSAINSSPTIHKHDPILLSLHQYLIHTNHQDSQADPYHNHPQSSSTHTLPTSRWFILDLSIYNDTTVYLYNWLCTSFIQNTFVFWNQHTIYWNHNSLIRVAYAKKNQYNSSHGTANLLGMHLVKIIVLVHPKLLENRTNGGLSQLEPLPVLDFISNYNPILQITHQLPKLLKMVMTPSTGGSSILSILQLVVKILLSTPQQTESSSPEKSLYNRLTPTIVDNLLIKLKILINQLRKCRLANGLYTETEVEEQEKKDILICSIELRQKVKSSYQAMTEMQEIEKQLDGERKEMYKMYASIFNAVINVGATEGRQISFNPNYLNVSHLKQYIKDYPLSKNMQSVFQKNLKILDQKLIPEIGYDTIAKIIVQAVFSTLSAYCISFSQREKLSKQILSIFVKKSTEEIKESPKKKANKKIGRNKKNEGMGLTLNHPNLLNLPSTHSSSTTDQPTPFSLVSYFYNISTDSWQKWHELCPVFLLPNSINCSSSTQKRALHPSEILRLNPYINIGVKQSILKNYCNACNVQYDLNVMKNYLNEDIVWSHYLVVYGAITTVIRREEKKSMEIETDRNYEETHFYRHLRRLNATIKQQEMIYLKITNGNAEMAKKWLQSKHETVLNYQMYHHRLSTAFLSVQKQSSTNQDKDQVTQWHVLTDKNAFNMHKIFVIDVIASHDPISAQQLNNFCCGVSIVKLAPSPQQRYGGKIHAVLQTYMKYKNITSITQVILSQDLAAYNSSKRKSKQATSESKHYSHEPSAQDHEKYKKQLSQVTQIHLQRIVTLLNLQVGGMRKRQEFYDRICRILLQTEGEDSDIPINRYYAQLDVYGIDTCFDRLDAVYEIYWMINTAIRQEKLMRNQMLMNSSSNINTNSETNAIEQFRSKSEENIINSVSKFLQNNPPVLFHHSSFLSYIPRYMLPKPKKYKTNSILLNEGSLVYNGYFAQLIDLQSLSKLAIAQENKKMQNKGESGKPNNEAQEDRQVVDKQKNKIEETNEIYATKLYKIEHSYANIYELNENVIIGVVKSTQTDVGTINVDRFIEGFLLYTKSRVFIQSQIQSPQEQKNELLKSQVGQAENSSCLHYTKINIGAMGFNKQFSLSDAKVSRIIHDYWKNQKKPLIKVIYKCLFYSNGQSFEQEIKWMAEVDINNSQKYTYRQAKQQEQNSEKKLSKNRRIKQSKFKSNTSYSQSMMSNMSSDQDAVMGILTFVQIVNQSIAVEEAMRLLQNTKGNQYCILLIHDNSAAKPNVIDQKLAGYLWVLHQASPKQEQQVDISSQLLIRAGLPPHLTSIYTQKYSQIYQKLSQLHVNKFTTYYIPQGVIGKVYIPAIARKRQQIKDVIMEKRQQRASKKQVYDNCVMEIQTLRNKIEQSELIIQNNTDKIAEWTTLLSNFTDKLKKYIGDQEFHLTKQKILEIPRKSIEKEVLKSVYIQENPLNLSFIYRFNVLADNAYFPDKNFQVYQHIYKIGGKYAIFEEQKKQFIKLINMGRLNILLQNEDYWPNQDQIMSSEKVKKQFEYLGLTNINSETENGNYSLSNLLIKEQLKFIEEKAETPTQQIFHRYISFLSAHAYVKHYLSSNKAKLQKNIRDCQEESKILTNKIKDYRLMLKQQEQKQVTYKSRYERSIEEVLSCEENQRIYVEIANANVAKLNELLEHNVFGVKGQEKEKVLREISQFLVYGLSTHCQHCLRISTPLHNEQGKIYHPLSIQARRYLFYLLGISTVKNKLMNYKIDSVSALYDVIYLFLLKQELKIETNLILHSCREFGQELYKGGIDDRNYNVVTHESAPDSAIKVQQLEHIIALQIFPQYAEEASNLLRKLERIESLLEGSFHKFAQRVDLIHSKQLQSIRKFEINQEIVETVLEGFRNQTLQFEGLDYLGDWKIRNKSSANLCSDMARLLSNTHVIKQLLNNLGISETIFPKIFTRSSLRYFCSLLGQTIRRSNQIGFLLSSNEGVVKSTVIFLMKQFIYDHTPWNAKSVLPYNQLRMSEEIIEEQLIHKQSMEKLIGGDQRKVLNNLCLLDSVLALNFSILFIQADSKLESMIKTKAQKRNYKILWKQIKFESDSKAKKNEIAEPIKSQEEQRSEQNQTKAFMEHEEPVLEDPIYKSNEEFQYFHFIEDTTAQHWIIYYIHRNTFWELSQIKQNHLKLEQDIKKNKQQNTKYMFVVRSPSVIDYIESQVQPVYRIYANNNIFAKLRHSQYLNPIGHGEKQDRHIVHQRNSIQLGNQLIGQLFQYYSSIYATCNPQSNQLNRNFLHLFTINKLPKNLTNKPQLEEADHEAEQQEEKLINQDQLLYAKSQCLPILYRLLETNPLITSSSIQYRILKKLIALLFADDEQAYDILQGWQIFETYYRGKLTQAKYKKEHIKMAVEQAHRNRKTGPVIQTNPEMEMDELSQDQLQKVMQVNKIRQRYEKFLLFIQSAHQKCCVDLSCQEQITSTKMEPKLLLTEDFLTESHLLQNKAAYTTKIKDPTEQIIKSLFVKNHSSGQSKSYKSTFNEIYSNENLLLADPKIYIILNKTLKKALNKIAIAKNNKKSSVGTKEGKVKRKLLLNLKQAQKMLENQIFMKLFNSVSGLHRVQFLMWMFSQSQNLKMNNICFSVKQKINNSFQQTGSDDEKQPSKEERIDELIDQKLGKNNRISYCFKFQLHCVNTDQLLFPIHSRKEEKSTEVASCVVEMEISPTQMSKSNRPYRGLLFRYESQFKEVDQPNSHNFKMMSANREDEFLRPHITQGSKEQSRQGSSPSISKQQIGSQSPSSPATRMNRNRKNTVVLNQSMKQSVNLSKFSYFILPVYCHQIQIGVLEIDLRACKGLDPIRSYAILK